MHNPSPFVHLIIRTSYGVHHCSLDCMNFFVFVSAQCTKLHQLQIRLALRISYKRNFILLFYCYFQSNLFLKWNFFFFFF